MYRQLFNWLIILFILGAIGYTLFRLFKRTDAKDAEDHVQMPKYLIWTVALAILGYNIFAYDVPLGIGKGLFNLFVVVGLLFSFEKEKRTVLVYSLAALGGITGLLFGFRANEFVQNVNMTVVWLVLIALILLHAVDHIKWFGTWLIKTIGRYAVQAVKQVVLLLRFSGSSPQSTKGLVINILKTLIITAVIVFFFLNLLASADPVFNKLIEKFQDEVVWRTIFSIFIGIVLTWLLTIHIKTDDTEGVRLKFISFYDVFVPSALLALIFAFFLWLQAKYLFGSHEALKAFDLTYSEYVRKGFVELLSTAFFGGLLVYFIFVKCNTLEQSSHMRKLKIINVVLLIELFLLLFSALQRDVIYVATYGLTRVRIIGEIFLGWLAIVLLLLLVLNLWGKMREKHLFSGIFAVSIAVIIALNSFNIDRTIALSAPPRDNPKDIFYTSILSADAITGWKDVISKAQQRFEEIYTRNIFNDKQKQEEFVDTKLAIYALKERRDELEKKFGSETDVKFVFFKTYDNLPDYIKRERKWQALNLSDKKAYDAIQQDKMLFYGVVDCLIEEFKNYQLTYHYNFSEFERSRIHDFQYPFINYSKYYNLGYIYTDLQRWDDKLNTYVYIEPSHPVRSCNY